MNTLRNAVEMGLLLLLLPLGAHAREGKQPYPDRQRTEWNNMGFSTSVLLDFEKNRWAPLTQKEVVRYAKDVAFLLMDDRLGSTKGVAVPVNSVMNDGSMVWKGWNVRLRFPHSKEEWVDMAIENTGLIRSIETTGDMLRGTYSLGRTLLTAHHWSANDLGWNKKTIAALTAMDVVRILGREFVNLYVQRIETNAAGDWIVGISSADTDGAPVFSIRLSPHFYLLDYAVQP